MVSGNVGRKHGEKEKRLPGPEGRGAERREQEGKRRTMQCCAGDMAGEGTMARGDTGTPAAAIGATSPAALEGAVQLTRRGAVEMGTSAAGRGFGTGWGPQRSPERTNWAPDVTHVPPGRHPCGSLGTLYPRVPTSPCPHAPVSPRPPVPVSPHTPSADFLSPEAQPPPPPLPGRGSDPRHRSQGARSAAPRGMGVRGEHHIPYASQHAALGAVSVPQPHPQGLSQLPAGDAGPFPLDFILHHPLMVAPRTLKPIVPSVRVPLSASVGNTAIFNPVKPSCRTEAIFAAWGSSLPSNLTQHSAGSGTPGQGQGPSSHTLRGRGLLVGSAGTLRSPYHGQTPYPRHGAMAKPHSRNRF
ncbi:cleavage and polyadenylation specificity factor subunit 6-like [Gallus gallus]|uniref:cleavage and polyadenylation specificity factor subunit 6-like n=1 Tax=Gallus gallus TaxID=9031 RepID=UPI001AEB22D6|nr:cleavage and polyadenylation specificity factor subunit 6-like [Gallus gallus]XP_040544075.1 cleavage and polyadenylation specificity factor subunit 6-like [Gallus gallus]XP_046758987.1 cleavage and polyadenylation specificity factor subunit 6-like [Gallus gallus]XP_046786973.1 cleavage and polyadenylation specificity factor subunit 6-like [Gallus gallus]